jgi:hypothetical protein
MPSGRTSTLNFSCSICIVIFVSIVIYVFKILLLSEIKLRFYLWPNLAFEFETTVVCPGHSLSHLLKVELLLALVLGSVMKNNTYKLHRILIWLQFVALG